ncbi:hypothetical protein [Gimesia panareensis]|uniref:hypothetical protein n=1 Tax=Gimesia panareensis TaxID=2527978 RepID=UPI0011A145D7|nr:hypothetical protein [Gimesia panareensis]
MNDAWWACSPHPQLVQNPDQYIKFWMRLRGQGQNLPTQPSDRLGELLPDVWFADHPEAKRKKAA